MEITIELIFMLAQAVITGVMGAFFKDRVVPSNLIPVQNIAIGLISSFIAMYFGIFSQLPTAIFYCLATSLGVGGGYDLVKTKSKQ